MVCYDNTAYYSILTNLFVDLPFLGVCLGLQLAVIEFARNKLGLADASSSELQQDSKNEIIIEMPEFNPVTKGGTMRLGRRQTVFTKKEDSILWKLYGKPDTVDERHRHRYEVSYQLAHYSFHSYLFSLTLRNIFTLFRNELWMSTNH